jgi:hypothetical protein
MHNLRAHSAQKDTNNFEVDVRAYFWPQAGITSYWLGWNG